MKYPNIEVNLSQSDGNAFMIISKVRRALRKNGVDDATVGDFTKEAESGDYDNVLRTCMKWVDVS